MADAVQKLRLGYVPQEGGQEAVEPGTGPVFARGLGVHRVGQCRSLQGGACLDASGELCGAALCVRTSDWCRPGMGVSS